MLRPEDVVERLEAAKIRAVPTGIDHGTITAVSSGHPFEITSLRRDVSTDGRRATVAFTDDWQEDAARRDFTINALSADPQTGEVYDYFGGKEDLLARRVRFIGDPLDRIAEDHLRILRFFRFHARFGEGEPDRDALDGLCRAGERLDGPVARTHRRRASEAAGRRGSVADGIDHARSRNSSSCPPGDRGEANCPGSRPSSQRNRKPESAPIRCDVWRAFLPREPALAERVAVRLKLSNKARKRLACAADAALPDSAQKLAYFVGIECAVDRLLLAGKTGARGEHPQVASTATSDQRRSTD